MLYVFCTTLNVNKEPTDLIPTLKVKNNKKTYNVKRTT